MKLPSYFSDFLAAIEPSASYKDDQQKGHKTLRKRLAGDEEFSKIHLNAFLQGSYKRHTAIHPGKDVDIVVVTSLDPAETTPAAANKMLQRCLSKYYDKVTPQNRSYCVSLSSVTMDVVIATSPQLRKEASLLESVRKADEIDNAKAWLEHPLLIPDRGLKAWVETDPKKQLEWTTALNASCDGFFVPLVKMVKWWRKEAYSTPKYPKGYVLERLVGECVDRSVHDHGEGFVRLLSNLQARYTTDVLLGRVPHLADPGVPGHNVAHRLGADDFATFFKKVETVLPVAQAALDHNDTGESAKLWAQVFGVKFPSPPAASKASFPATPVRPNKPAGFAHG